MKRKRGNKKGKVKKPKLVGTNEEASNAVASNTEENSGLDEFDNDSGVDAEAENTPSSSGGNNQPQTLPKAVLQGRQNSNTLVKAVYTRVKVKIKNSKNLESQNTASDACAHSDTDKSSQQVGLDKQIAPNEKMEDSANSLSETNGGVASGNTSKKSVGIKIKSSRGLGSSSMSPCSNSEPIKAEKVEKKDTESLHQESRYNEQELKAALEVIRKVMKMDAAEPFNVPVNPVALGIPDYFDVIDTPMDFGTICSNLEKGTKYKNSEDVFKDVQYIWDNCYKYNNKGDYIVDLMKRVKKSFMKYWTALGLYTDQPQETSGLESNPVKDLTPSSEGNAPANGSASMLAGKKFHGLRKHKEGCMCAICIMMRRRQEREEIARLMEGPTEGSDDSVGEDTKPEVNSHGESPFAEYASSNMENSPDADTETERKGQETKVGHIRNLYTQQNNDDTAASNKQEGSQNLDVSQRHGDQNSTHPQAVPRTRPDETTQTETPIPNETGKQKELLDKNQRSKMLENLRYLENPMLLELYGTLFSDDSKSFWNGHHSLVGCHNQRRTNSFHSAISSFMK